MILLGILLAQTAGAQTRTPSHCLAFADSGPPIQRAALTYDQVQISYADHSMYVIDTYGGLRVVTDYNGYIGQTGKVPDVVTMNKGHSSHYTSHPDPQIPHVLRGWDPKGGVADHELDLGEMLIRNVTTDIRSVYSGQEPDGNSIFIFEVAGLCIGHLGHLHHIPTDEQFARIGRLDVVMAAVDGSMTLDLPSMVALLKRLRASVVLPMHWFGRSTLDRFVAGMRDSFDIQTLPDSSFVISQDLLPSRPTVMIVPPRFVTEYE
ncbi:MBL fold metallo-hydrolase [Neptunicoccus sediminis]|uniref:MBL fold metallo-hydrolase n=1 Tax=Neptunicoccus sediminis TaxID=1892596 RepID=UPI000A703344